MELKSYWSASRSHRYSLLFALPLLILYEVLAASLHSDLSRGGEVRNGADVILKTLFSAIAGPYGPILLGAILIGGSLWLVIRDVRRNGGRWGVAGSDARLPVFLAMFAESVLLALAFGVVVGGITQRLLRPFLSMALGPVAEMDWWTRVMISLGAGLYEELLFRVLLVSALALVAKRLFGLRVRAAGVVAAVSAAFIFSSFHYVGPFGDALELTSFTFRFIGGLFFSGLFLLRGFGITAWTHALYDLFLLAL
ncbi:MAG: type II CAAX prenyl endopeptidase Rce1 family protein [Gemmatimonadaceae bacterium]